MDKKNKVTIKEVAAAAGVGLGTVSRAMNGSTAISPETKRKVLESIRALGYVPDPAAQSMRSGKYKNIAYFVDDISNTALSTIAKGMQDLLESMGYTLILYNTGDMDLTEKFLSVVRGRKLDGIVLSIPSENNLELNLLLTESQLPIVTIDREVPGISSGVLTDYTYGVRQATTYLLSLGHRGILLLVGTRSILPTRAAIQGFREAFTESGQPFHEEGIVEGELTIEFGRKAILERLPQIRNKEITAAITLNNNIFKGILHATRENGLAYPHDISLIVAEDSDLTQYLQPSITIIYRPLLEIGQSVAKYLVNCIENPATGRTAPPYAIQTSLIIRDSCQVSAE